MQVKRTILLVSFSCIFGVRLGCVFSCMWCVCAFIFIIRFYVCLKVCIVSLEIVCLRVCVSTNVSVYVCMGVCERV